jgi:hypothetical protein
MAERPDRFSETCQASALRMGRRWRSGTGPLVGQHHTGAPAAVAVFQAGDLQVVGLVPQVPLVVFLAVEAENDVGVFLVLAAVAKVGQAGAFVKAGFDAAV